MRSESAIIFFSTFKSNLVKSFAPKTFILLFTLVGVYSTVTFFRGGNFLPFPDNGGGAILATSTKEAQLAVLTVLNNHGGGNVPVMKDNSSQVDRAFLRNDTIVNFTRLELSTRLGNPVAGYQIVTSNPLDDAQNDASILQAKGFTAEWLADPEGDAAPETLVFLKSNAFGDGRWILVYRRTKVKMNMPKNWTPEDWTVPDHGLENSLAF